MQVEVVNNNLTRQMDIFGRWLSLLVLIIMIAAFLLARFRANEPWQGAFEVGAARPHGARSRGCERLARVLHACARLQHSGAAPPEIANNLPVG